MPTKKNTWLVSDYMRKTVVTIPLNATLKEALALMIRERTNGLVVIDKRGKVAGILSSWDFIQHIVPDYLEEDKHLASFESSDMFVKRAQKIAQDPITKFMTKAVHMVQPSHSLIQAAALLSTFHIRQLPVVDASGQLVGFLNRTDVKIAMGRALEVVNDSGGKGST